MPAVKGSASSVAYTLGPGAPTPAVKALLVATIGVFVVQYIADFVDALRPTTPSTTR